MHPNRTKTPLRKHRPNRSGYALLLVMVFVVLFSAILGVAWRRVASVLRIECLSEMRKQCDAGSVQVLAQALKVLEIDLRWDALSNEIKFKDSTAFPKKYYTSDGNKWYTITFTRTDEISQPTEWSIRVKVVNVDEALACPDGELPKNPP